MARINTLFLAAQVAGAAEGVARANRVRQDPAVVKAAKTAMVDVAQAGRSVSKFAYETQSSWRRHSGRSQ